MNRYPALIGLLALVTLPSCQTQYETLSLDSPQSEIPVGSRIELHQPLNLYPGYSRSFIQSGHSEPFSNIDQRLPFCQFIRYEPPKALETLRVISPDEFRVTQSDQTTETGMFALSILVSTGSSGIKQTEDQLLSSTLTITSEKQPDIVSLKCSILDQPDLWNFVSVNQIKVVLGDIASIKISLP